VRSILVVHVKDLHDHPIANVRLRAGDSSMSADSYGAARVKLAPQTKPGDVILLEIVEFPKNKDLVFISPWDKWVHVPPFENDAKNFVPVTLAERGDRACLENSNCLRAAAAQINKANAPRSVAERSGEEQRGEALATIAKQFGLKPEEIDRAIRAWGQRTEDPYDKGLTALYEKRYPEASTQLAMSFKMRQGAEAVAREKAADAAMFLGQSLYQQGKYRQSAEAYEEAAARRPEDGMVLNNLGLSWADAGEYGKAETLYRRALAINEKALGSGHYRVATNLSNLANLRQDKGDYAAAEPLFRRALAIDEKALGPDHPTVSTDLNNLAGLLQDRGDYTAAEPLYRRALAINEKALGPDHPTVAIRLSNLAGLLRDKKDYTAAEPLYRRALAIGEQTLGPDHPTLAIRLNNLGNLLRDKGDYTAAELLLHRALAIDEKALGPDHPTVATILNNLAESLRAKKDYIAAEPLFRRALGIDEKVLGPNHPMSASDLNNLAGLLQDRGDYTAAEPLYRRALAIDEKALGPDHPKTKQIRSNLESLQSVKSKPQ
jgi:tetratricopeptide (TPR) repeat protein